MKKYKYELAVTIVGGVVSVIELFLNLDFGFFILANTIILDLALLGMRFLVANELKESNELYKCVYNISSSYWREIALFKYNELKEYLQSMQNGVRKIDSKDITSEELRLIKQAKASIYCIYLADSIVKLKMRLSNNANFNPMYTVNFSYNSVKQKELDRRRVFILDKLDLNDSVVMALINDINAYYKNMNFEIRFIFLSKLKEINLPYFGNTIISDSKECTVCIDHTEYPIDYMDKGYDIKRKLSCENIISPMVLHKHLENFLKIWEMSVDIDKLF